MSQKKLEEDVINLPEHHPRTNCAAFSLQQLVSYEIPASLHNLFYVAHIQKSAQLFNP